MSLEISIQAERNVTLEERQELYVSNEKQQEADNIFLLSPQGLERSGRSQHKYTNAFPSSHIIGKKVLLLLLLLLLEILKVNISVNYCSELQ